MNARHADLVVRGGTARFRGRCFPCRIGHTGVTPCKQEGDGATPVGVHRAQYVLYRPDRVPPFRCRLPVQPVRRGMGWSDDPADPLYNQPVPLPHPYGAEAMWLARNLYDIVVPLDWNRTPPIPGDGSAIFMHVADHLGRPTAGCVAFARPHLQWILAHWQRNSRVIIEPCRAIR